MSTEGLGGVLERLSGALHVLGLAIEEHAYYEPGGVRPSEHRRGDGLDELHLLVCRWAGVSHTYWGLSAESCADQAVEDVRQGAFIGVERASLSARDARTEELRQQARYRRLLAFIDGRKEKS